MVTGGARPAGMVLPGSQVCPLGSACWAGEGGSWRGSEQDLQCAFVVKAKIS